MGKAMPAHAGHDASAARGGDAAAGTGNEAEHVDGRHSSCHCLGVCNPSAIARVFRAPSIRFTLSTARQPAVAPAQVAPFVDMPRDRLPSPTAPPAA